MTETQLQQFRQLAATLAGPGEPRWQWIDQHMSQRMFGITRKRAEDYAARFGGVASPMEATDATGDWTE